MNSKYQNKKAGSYKLVSANAFFPSYSQENLVIISTDISKCGGSYVSHRAANFALGQRMAFRQLLINPISAAERCWSCVLQT
jgi:hypothetical protein